MKQSSMPALVIALSLAAVCSLATIANDNETTSTSNTTKNPLTGTVKTEKTAKHKRTHGDGSVSEKNAKDTVKYKTNGEVEAKKTEESVDSPK